MLHDDLLKQARHLATKEPKRPRQSSLRRSVSVAYYSLFHLFGYETSLQFVKGEGKKVLRPIIRRTLDHSSMKKASESFANKKPGNRIKKSVASSIPVDLIEVALTFRDLQEYRHEADYDTSRIFSKFEVKGIVDRVENAFLKWKNVRKTKEANAYLMALLFHKNLKA